MGIQTCERKSNCSDLNSIALRAVKGLKSQSIEHNQVVRVHLTLANMFVGAKHDRSQYGIVTNN